MAEFFPDADAQIAYIGPQYGWLLQEPQVYTALAGQIHDEAGSSADGRYHKPSGETHGTAVLKRQDTFLQGTASRVGLPFVSVQGTWKDDFLHPRYNTYCLGVPDGSPSTSNASLNEVVARDATADIEHGEMWLQWGLPPVSTDGTDYSHARDKRYTYVQLAYKSPDNQDYRIRFEYGQPIALDVTYDGGKTWAQGVSVLKDLGNFERYLAAHNNEIAIRLTPSVDNKILGVEVGDGNMLVHQPDPSKVNPAKKITSFQDSDHLLPRNGKVRVMHRNGTLKFGYFPSRFQDIVLNKAPINLGDKVKDLSGAFVTTNGLIQTPPDQTHQTTVTTDGNKVGWQITAKRPDAGDGQGSDAPARIADSSIVIAAKWGTVPAGTPLDFAPGVVDLRGNYVEEIETWDDIRRCASSSATLRADNHWYQWNNLVGNLAVNLQASNGGRYFQRMQGVVNDDEGGIAFSRCDPDRSLTLQCTDKSRMMMRALDEERIFDGWCIYSIVRYLCEKGNIHPAFLQSIPLYIPPGATAEAPYGQAGYDCPYYSLPRGMGNQPLFRFYPDTSIWRILQTLVQFMTSVDPTTGLPVAWYMGFDPAGQFHFEPVAAYNLPLAMAYSSFDPTGQGLIEGQLVVENDVSDMRTSVDFQAWMRSRASC